MQLSQSISKTEARALTTPRKKLLTVKEVCAMLGLSRSMIYKCMKDPANPFPAPLKIGAASRWVIDDIHEWTDAARNVRDC